jgi:hypothetical protein
MPIVNRPELSMGVVLSAAALMLCGCARAHPSLGSQANSNAQVMGPGQTAVAYMAAVYSGRIQAAAEFIRPSDRPLFRDISRGLAPNSTKAENLQAGKVTINADHAIVTLTGTLCATGSSPASPGASSSPTTRCLSNTDPNSRDPVFALPLEAQSAGGWFVVYPAHPATSAGTSASGAGTP